jgi:hypothetical protein
VLARATDLLTKLRAVDDVDGPSELASEWSRSGVRFVASPPHVTQQYSRAVRELFGAIKAPGPILHEGGVYQGCWLESTGTINAELLSRFLPQVAERTFASFAQHQREDGLFPYKVTASGPAFSQIQTVTPLARSVWTHYRLNGRPRAFLETMYAAMARNDEWLAAWRDTRGTGGVEAFCTYDTGHDLSARFWHMPDSPLENDPKRYDANNPFLPLVAPDLTANVACQRRYLADIAAELGEDGAVWRDKARQSEAALYANCWHEDDGFFYDLDRKGEFIRVQSDVLLRVLACEIGDDAFFDAAFDYNSWSGPSNFLSIIRAPHAFEAHHRHVELTWAMQPILSALFRAPRFAQTLSPWTGEAGYTDTYTPSILCLLDFVERLSGILPRPDGTLWFTGLVPVQMEHRDQLHETAYARTVDGQRFELVNSGAATTAYRDEALLYSAPKGVRVVTDRSGTIRSIIGMSAAPVEGALEAGGTALAFRAEANEQLDLIDGNLVSVRKGGYVAPTT